MKCRVCGGKDFIPKFEKDDIEIVQCKNCGLVYLNPRPKDELIPILYDSDYFSSQSSIGFDNYYSDEVRQGMYDASKRRLLVLKQNGISTSGKALEVRRPFLLVMPNLWTVPPQGLSRP